MNMKICTVDPAIEIVGFAIDLSKTVKHLQVSENRISRSPACRQEVA